MSLKYIPVLKTNPKGYCRKRFKENPLLYLSTCCVGSQILDQIEAAVEEALSSQSWVDIMQLLPSVFDENDAEQIIQEVLKTSKNLSSKDALVIGQSAVVSQLFLTKMKPIFDPMIISRAEQVVKSGAYLQAQADLRNAKMKSMSRTEVVGDKKDRKEERRKKANEGKLGGGTQGRETKTRATKKKYLRGKNDSDDEFDDDDTSAGYGAGASSELDFMTVDEIADVLRKEEALLDAPEEFVTEIAARLFKTMNSSFQDAARASFEALLSASSGQRRQTHGELQEKLQNLLQNIRQGDKALQHFSSLDVQQQLARHLLKTLGSEFTSDLVLYLAQDLSISADIKDLNPDTRLKMIGDLPQSLKPSLQALHKSSLGSNVEEFLTSAESSLSACDIVLRKLDKKKEKSLSMTQRQSLIEQLSLALDAALVLHIAVLLLFHAATQTLLNASGRFSLKPSLQALHKSSLGSNVEEFLTSAESSLSACDIVLRKLDKKKEKSLSMTQRQSLIEQLSLALDAALVLHIAVLLLFHAATQTLLNASGRFVPQIISFLQTQIPPATHELLVQLQGLVIQELNTKDDEEKLVGIREKMEGLMPRVRESAILFKKSTAASRE
nr:EOG090X0267 [Polyphemus pediculus]